MAAGIKKGAMKPGKCRLLAVIVHRAFWVFAVITSIHHTYCMYMVMVAISDCCFPDDPELEHCQNSSSLQQA